jgi:hypothetical protein
MPFLYGNVYSTSLLIRHVEISTAWNRSAAGEVLLLARAYSTRVLERLRNHITDRSFLSLP